MKEASAVHSGLVTAKTGTKLKTAKISIISVCRLLAQNGINEPIDRKNCLGHTNPPCDHDGVLEAFPMKATIGLFILALCSSLTTTAQILPNGGCGCRLSGSTMGCSCGGSVSKVQQNVPSQPSQLIETLITLSPDALLTKGVLGDDEVFIPIGIGRLVNEAKSPVVQIPIGEVSMFLMPRGEPYSLRNVGKQDLKVRVIRIHHTDSAFQ